MRQILFSALLFGLCATAAFAQPEFSQETYNGTWKVSIQPGAGKPRVAKLVLMDYAGTWYNVTTTDRTKAKICNGKKFPITVHDSSSTELEFTAWGSSVSPQCPDISVTVRPISATVLEGTLATGESVRALRE